MKIKDTLCQDSVTDRTAKYTIAEGWCNISSLLEAAEYGDLVSCRIVGNAGYFTVIGELWGDENGNKYVGDSRVFTDELRYTEHGGASRSVMAVTLI